MSDTPHNSSPASGHVDHAWIHERLGAAIAGGLDEHERGQFDAHINGCAECFDAFTEARDADRQFQRAIAPLAAGKEFDEALAETIREKIMHKRMSPAVKRAGMAIAAAVALAASGVFAQYVVVKTPLTRPLADEVTADARSRGITLPFFFAGEDKNASEKFNTREKEPYFEKYDAYAGPSAADNVRGIVKSKVVYAGEIDAPAAQGKSILLGRAQKESAASASFADQTVKKLEQAAPEARWKLSQAETNDGRIGASQRGGGWGVGGVGKGGIEDSRTEFDREAKLRSGQGAAPSVVPAPPHIFDDARGSKAQQQNFVPDFKATIAGTPAASSSYFRPVTEDSGANGDRTLALTGTTRTGGTTVSGGVTLAVSTDGPPPADATGAASDLGEKSLDPNGMTQKTVEPFDVAMAPKANVGTGKRDSGDQVSDLMAQSKSLGDQQKYREQADTLRQVLKADPNNDTAKAELQSTNEKINYGEFDGSGKTPKAGDRDSAIPYPDLMTYPENWAELTRNHTTPDPNSSANQAVHERLSENIAEVTADKKPLEQVVDDLRTAANTNIFVDWKALEAAGVKKDTPVSVDLKGASYDQVLRKVLASAAGGDGKLGYAVDDGVITVAAGGTAVPATAPAPVASEAAVAARKIIRNGVVEFEVRSFDDASAMIAAVTTEEGGFVSSTSSDKLANGKIRGQVVVRVPPEHLDRLLLKLRALGDLKTQQIGASDVTKEYTDTESELRALQAMESRMIDLIKNGKGEVKDLVVAEKQLGEYRVQIEKLEGDIRYYNNLVGMATLTINAYEKDIQKPTAASEMENVALSVETEDVEGKYLAARKILDDAKGRIVESELKKLDADQYDAHIVVDVPPDKSDLVTAELRQLGKVANYTRDRKQTTSGGTGMPQVQVEEKDTHFTITLYNLANVAPRETALLTVAVRDVAGTYRRMLGLVRQPLAGAPEMNGEPAAPLSNGRVITSTINGQQPEQMVADIHADIRADQADAVIQAIRDAGEVLSSNTTENPDTSNVTSSKRGLQLHLVNIDAVPARETAVLTIAVQDVDKAYHDTLAMLQKPLAAVKEAKPGETAKPEAAPGSETAPVAVGHVEASTINGEQPEQMVADIRGDIVADRAEAILQAIRSSGEVLASSSVQNPDKVNSTAVKNGIQIRFINAAVVPAREVQVLHTVAASVPDAYRKLIDALQVQMAAGMVRMLGSQLNESDPRTVSAALSFEARRGALPEVDKAFTNAGVDFLSRTITRSNDTANTLDSKVKFQIDDLIAADALPPRSTTTLRIEVDDVEKSLETLRGTLATSPVKEIEFNLAKDPEKGPVSGHLIVETPVGNAMAVLMHIKDLGGTEKVNQVVKNTQVPDAPFARERIDLTLVNHASLVESGKGVGATIRAALGSAAIALLWSLYLILTGVLFVGPFALIVWIIARLARRRRGVPAR